MEETRFSIHFLLSGGLITNYNCTSRCRHCLYKCSPGRDKKYIDKDTTRENIRAVQSKSCNSLHIGGGEPFLNTDKLYQVMQVAREENMHIEYVETNSSWFKSEKDAVEILTHLRKEGLSTVLVSISPFHNEYIPFYKVKGVINACRKAEIGIFPWTEGFINDLQQLDENTSHSLEEYAEHFGQQYVSAIPTRYWIHFGGRAIETYKSILRLKKTDDIISNPAGCTELTDTSHFHVDLYGKYIPGLCSGFGIDNHDLEKPLEADKYPLIHTLYNEGIKGLYNFAKHDHGFVPQNEYLNKCHLCLDIREFLFNREKFESVELHPGDFYET